MKRREFLQAFGFSALALTSIGFSAPGKLAGARPRRSDASSLGTSEKDLPNVVLIMADDLGYGDLGCYGHPENKTPHLDRLAQGGIKFTDFHSNGPMCTPTRAALLTGLYQNRFGREFETALSAKAHRDKGLPRPLTTLPEALREAGYATGMYGKWHLGYEPPHIPVNHGFQDFQGLLSGDGDHHSHIDRSGNKDWWHNKELQMEEGYSVDLITSHAVDFMRRSQDRPFFLYVPHLAIHFPWQGPEEDGHRVEGKSYWNLSKLGPHGEGEVGPVVKKMVESVDRSVGMIIAALRRMSLDRETLVIFCSDNGGYLEYAGKFQGEISHNGPLRGQKTDVWEGGHRVPAIMWWPGQIDSGRVTDETVLTMDIMPTLLEIAGVDPPSSAWADDLDGRSITDHIFRGEPLPEKTFFWRAGDQWAVRRGPWKLVRIGDQVPELYNLEEDIGESQNLAGRRPDLVRELRQAFREWEAEVAVE